MDLDFKTLMVSTEADASFEVAFEITFQIPLDPYMIVFLGSVDLKMSEQGNIW